MPVSGRAGQTFAHWLQRGSADAYQPGGARGIALDQRKRSDIARYDCTGSHQRKIAYGHTGKYHRPRSDGASALKYGQWMGHVSFRAGITVVGETYSGANEHIVLDTQAVVQGHEILYRHPVAQNYVVLDEDAIANIAVASKPRAWKNVGEGPHPASCPHRGRFADALGVDEDVRA